MSDLPRQLEVKGKDLQDSFETFRKDVTKRALQILTEAIPRKIRYLDSFQLSESVDDTSGSSLDMSDFPDMDFYRVANLDIRNDPENEVKPFSSTSNGQNNMSTPNESCVQLNEYGKRVKTDTLTKVSFKLPEYIYLGGKLTNPAINQRIERISRESYDLLEIVTSVRLWVHLNIPKIEDGNNFGVAIQEEAVSILNHIEEIAYTMRDFASKYYMQRAKLVTKILKYPNVEDYRFTLRALDEKHWFHMKFSEAEARNNYTIIFDMMQKNWQKVIKPRTTDGNSMVY